MNVTFTATKIKLRVTLYIDVSCKSRAYNGTCAKTASASDQTSPVS